MNDNLLNQSLAGTKEFYARIDEDQKELLNSAGKRLFKKRKEYIPSKLRKEINKSRKVAYAIGVEEDSGCFAMTNRPTSNESIMLEKVPTKENSFIIRFNSDYTEDILWKWKEDRWIYIGPEN